MNCFRTSRWQHKLCWNWRHRWQRLMTNLTSLKLLWRNWWKDKRMIPPQWLCQKTEIGTSMTAWTWTLLTSHQPLLAWIISEHLTTSWIHPAHHLCPSATQCHTLQLLSQLLQILYRHLVMIYLLLLMVSHLHSHRQCHQRSVWTPCCLFPRRKSAKNQQHCHPLRSRRTLFVPLLKSSANTPTSAMRARWVC